MEFTCFCHFLSLQMLSWQLNPKQAFYGFASPQRVVRSIRQLLHNLFLKIVGFIFPILVAMDDSMNFVCLNRQAVVPMLLINHQK